MNNAMRSAMLLLVGALIAPATVARAGECDVKVAEMRRAFQQRPPVLISEAPRAPGWLRDLVIRFQAEKDVTKRAGLIGDGIEKAIGKSCREPFARTFANAAGIFDVRAKEAQLKRDIPETALACRCQGVDVDAFKVLMLLDPLNPLGKPKPRPSAAVTRAIDKLARQGGVIYRFTFRSSKPECFPYGFSPGGGPGAGYVGKGRRPSRKTDLSGSNYEWLDGTLTLTEKNMVGGEMLPCLFEIPLGGSGESSLTLDGETFYLSEAVCLAQRSGPSELPRHPACFLY